MKDGAKYPFYNWDNKRYTAFDQPHKHCFPPTFGDETEPDMYPGYVLCMADEFGHIDSIPNWNPKGGKRYYNIPIGSTWSGLKFKKETFKPLIENSTTVFINENERQKFLQIVEDCKYIWDGCIEFYCNKKDRCSDVYWATCVKRPTEGLPLELKCTWLHSMAIITCIPI